MDGCETKGDVAQAVRVLANHYANSLMRPFGTCRAPLVDAFCHRMVGQQTAEELAQDMGISREKLFDNMLLCLFDALFLKQSEEWSKVSNTPADETPELAKWFMKGQAVGSKPIFDGLCAQCGTLLHGLIGQNSALSNKVVASPIDRDGNLLIDEDGSPRVGAQPPFLLRYSPALFAKEDIYSLMHAQLSICPATRIEKIDR